MQKSCYHLWFLSEEADPGFYTLSGCLGVHFLQAGDDVLVSGTRHDGGLQHLLDVPELDDVVLAHCGEQLTAGVIVQVVHNSPEIIQCKIMLEK